MKLLEQSSSYFYLKTFEGRCHLQQHSCPSKVAQARSSLECIVTLSMRLLRFLNAVGRPPGITGFCRNIVNQNVQVTHVTNN